MQAASSLCPSSYLQVPVALLESSSKTLDDDLSASARASASMGRPVIGQSRHVHGPDRELGKGPA